MNSSKPSTPDYEIVCVDGKPRAITLQETDCSEYGRFVALSNTPDGMALALTDTHGKQLHLAHPDTPVDFSAVDLSLTVFLLTESGDTSSQFDVFLEF